MKSPAGIDPCPRTCYPKGERMDLPEPADFPVRGPKRNVDLANWSGRGQTESDWEGMDVRPQAKFVNRFTRLALDGFLPHPEFMDHIGDEIHEIKIPGHWRAAAFEETERQTWYITHFFETDHRKAAVKRARKKACEARDEQREAERRANEKSSLETTDPESGAGEGGSEHGT